MGHRVKIIILTRVQGRLKPPLVIFRQSFQLTYYYAQKAVIVSSIKIQALLHSLFFFDRIWSVVKQRNQFFSYASFWHVIFLKSCGFNPST